MFRRRDCTPVGFIVAVVAAMMIIATSLLVR